MHHATPFCQWVSTSENYDPSIIHHTIDSFDTQSLSTTHPLFPFLVYYGNQEDFRTFNRFATTVLEPDFYPDVVSCQSECYAYLSLGEVHPSRRYFQKLHQHGKLGFQHAYWESFMVPLTPLWQSIILEEIIPSIVMGGYRGIMLDTVDSILYYNLATKEQLIALIQEIKKKFPTLKIMLNRAFELAPLVPIDTMLLESTLSGYDFEKESCFLYEEVIDRRYPKIPQYSIDYWPKSDLKGTLELYKRALSYGYRPVITEISLRSLPVYTGWSPSLSIDHDG